MVAYPTRCQRQCWGGYNKRRSFNQQAGNNRQIVTTQIGPEGGGHNTPNVRFRHRVVTFQQITAQHTHATVTNKRERNITRLQYRVQQCNATGGKGHLKMSTTTLQCDTKGHWERVINVGNTKEEEQTPQRQQSTCEQCVCQIR